MKIKLFKADGTEGGEREFDNFPVLEAGKGVDALRQFILGVRANARQGNASTKTRDEVSGSGKKIYRQKGLGTGRAGDKRAIQRRGGGIAFGPKPRSFSQKINSRVKKLALTRALLDHALGGTIFLIEDWKVSEPKTKVFSTIVSKIDPVSRRLLAVDDSFDLNVSLAARNLPTATLGRATEINALDLVKADKVIISLTGIEALLNKLQLSDTKS
jgi:large subunit ribosomal protein L4